MQIHIGCSGFPVGRKRYYQDFKHVEVQITFYQILTDQRLEKWRNEAPEDFVFNIKAFQGITHPTFMNTWRRANIPREGEFGYFKDSPDVQWSWQQTLHEARILRSKFILVQLARSFRQTQENLQNVYKFFDKIDRDGFKIAIELRGWSEQWIRNLCKDFDLIDVVDLNQRDPVWLGNDEILYVRFHGRYDERGRIFAHYSYSVDELERMAEKVLSYDGTAKEAWINFNNTDMYRNALMFKEIVQDKLKEIS